MEIKELRSFFVNPSTETLNVEFNLETDGDDEIRTAEISLDEVLDFGYDFSTDRVPHRKTESGFVYRSPALEKLWPYGFSEIGNLEYDSARYVAGYIQKKVTGKKADDHYTIIDSSGECLPLHPEYSRMSRRPAIGLKWLEKYSSDIYNYDVCTVGTKQLRPPPYYDKWLKKTDEEKYTQIKLSREASMLDAPTSNMHDLTYTYAAKVIAAKQIGRSLEGQPALCPDSDRLDYYKRRMLENHFWQKRKSDHEKDHCNL